MRKTGFLPCGDLNGQVMPRGAGWLAVVLFAMIAMLISAAAFADELKTPNGSETPAEQVMPPPPRKPCYRNPGPGPLPRGVLDPPRSSPCPCPPCDPPPERWSISAYPNPLCLLPGQTTVYWGGPAGWQDSVAVRMAKDGQPEQLIAGGRYGDAPVTLPSGGEGSYSFRLYYATSGPPAYSGGYLQAETTLSALECVAPLSPSSGAFIRGAAPVRARITGTGRVTRVEYYLDDGLMSAVDNPPGCGATPCEASYSWDTTRVGNGSHALTVKALTADIGWSAWSRRVNVTVDNAAPTIQITQPPNPTFFQDPITIQTAVAAGLSGIKRVKFFVDGAPIGEATGPPYQITWSDTACVADGGRICQRQVTAEVENWAGASARSAPIQVTDAQAIVRGANARMEGPGNFTAVLQPSRLDYPEASRRFLNEAIRAIGEAYDMYFRVLQVFPNNTAAKAGLFKSIARLTEGHTLVGNQRFAEALAGPNLDYTGLEVDRAIRNLTEARQSFGAAVDNYLGRLVTSLSVAPNFHVLLRNAQPSRIDPYYSDAYWDWRLIGKAAGRRAFATRELAQKYWVRNTESDRAKAANLLAVGEIEAIGAWALLTDPEVVPPEQPAMQTIRRKIFASWQDLNTEKQEMSRAMRYMAEGRNVLGLTRSSIQFIRTDADTTQSNFDLHYQQAIRAINLAAPSFNRLVQARRDFERTVETYGEALQRNLNHYGGQLSRLCGPDYERQCPSGEIPQQVLRADIANNHVKQVLTEIQNTLDKIDNQIRKGDLAETIRRVQIEYVIQGGYQRATLLQIEAQLRARLERARARVGILGGIIQAATLNPAGLVTIARGLSDFAAAGVTESIGDLQAQREILLALERARIMDGDRELEQARYRTQILHMSLEIKKLNVDLEGANLTVALEAARLVSLTDEFSRVLTERDNWRRLTEGSMSNPFLDPTLRIMRDNYLDAFSRDQFNALLYSYSAALALLYEKNNFDIHQDVHWNSSECCGCQLEIRSPDDLLVMITPERLPAAVETLNRIWTCYRAQIEHGLIVPTKLSWLLGFRGPDASQQLRQYLLDHQEPDSPNVFITFPTNIAVPLRTEEDPAWGPALVPYLANAKIEYVQAFIQGGEDWSRKGRPFMLFLYYGFKDERGQPMPVTAYMRRPDADVRYWSGGRDAINYYIYDGVGPTTIQAGTGSPARIPWQEIPRNYKFLGRALGLDTWGLHICLDETRCPGNSDLIASLDQIEDIDIRFMCEGITLSSFP